MMTPPDEWTEGDRNAALEGIRTAYEECCRKPTEPPRDLAVSLAKEMVQLEVAWEALRECARRYLDATGRAHYGAETLENEVRFFTRLGENRIIERSNQPSEQDDHCKIF
jgi:hypothetical protein